MRNIKVTRHAVCAADDQANPLTLTIQIAGSESLEALIARILSRNFLQFSSSHSIITGFASDQPIVRVYPNFSSGDRPDFLISPDIPVEACLPNGLLKFMWVNSNNSSRPTPLRGATELKSLERQERVPHGLHRAKS